MGRGGFRDKDLFRIAGRHGNGTTAYPQDNPERYRCAPCHNGKAGSHVRLGTRLYQKDVRKWINRQLTRYRKDGFGYFAVILKENGTLIGQAGLMKSTINGNEAVELGYILDNAYWHNGYGTEAARACLEYAFGELAQKTVCCSIRPENGASIRVAERLGMTLCGSHTVIYNEKKCHTLYMN